MTSPPISKFYLDAIRVKLTSLVEKGEKLMESKIEDIGWEKLEKLERVKENISHFVGEFNKVAEFDMAHASDSHQLYVRDDEASEDAGLYVTASGLLIDLRVKIAFLEKFNVKAYNSVTHLRGGSKDENFSEAEIDNLPKESSEVNRESGELRAHIQQEKTLREKLEELETKVANEAYKDAEVTSQMENLRLKFAELEEKVVESGNKLCHREGEGKILREKLEKTEAKVEELGARLEEQLRLVLKPAIEKPLDCSKSFPRCYIDLSTPYKYLGRLLIKLRIDIAPRTAERFRALCAREGGFSYGGYSYEQIYDKLARINIAAGYFYDPTENPPTIRDSHFPAEENELKHVGPGVVSMRKNGPGTCSSQFNITYDCAGFLDTNDYGAVVFGVVVEGMEVLSKIKTEMRERSGTSIIVRDCGQCE